jgi:hypothetical protein
VVGGCKRLHNEGLHNLYASPNIIRVIKSRRMRWAVHIAHMERKRNTIFCLKNLKGRDHSEDLGVDGKMIIECILRK